MNGIDGLYVDGLEKDGIEGGFEGIKMGDMLGVAGILVGGLTPYSSSKAVTSRSSFSSMASILALYAWTSIFCVGVSPEAGVGGVGGGDISVEP